MAKRSWRQNKSQALALAFGVFLLTAGAPWAPSAAKTFANAYISFDLPDAWGCALENTEWVCTETGRTVSPSIIIMTAKEVGDEDSLDQYFDHLNKARWLNDKDGKPLRRSKTVFVKREIIGGRSWVTSEQFKSEIANFYTRYYATVIGRVAILVTFSAHRSVSAEAFDRFGHTVDTLQVFDPTQAR